MLQFSDELLISGLTSLLFLILKLYALPLVMMRVFESRVLMRIFGPKREEVTEEWRRLYNEELNDLYSSPNIFRVITSRRIRWAEHIARMGERCIQGFDWET
jgi:hypothetical protein